jgi:hypothetical protein
MQAQQWPTAASKAQADRFQSSPTYGNRLYSGRVGYGAHVRHQASSWKIAGTNRKIKKIFLRSLLTRPDTEMLLIAAILGTKFHIEKISAQVARH